MQKEILQKIHIRLSKVILLRDAFTEETVMNGVQIRILPGGGNPVRKSGGYWLFLDMGQEGFEIEIESPIYQSRKVLLKPDQGEEVEEIFLYPSGAYPVRPGYTMLRGTAEPGTVICFHLEEGMTEGRLIHDCSKGDQEIFVYMRNGTSVGRKWYIRDREKQTGEYIQIRELPDDSQQCSLLHPLKYNYRKKDTVLDQAYECAADEDGRFFLLLDHLKEQKITLYYSYIENGKEFCNETEFEPREGKMIQIHDKEGKS